MTPEEALKSVELELKEFVLMGVVSLRVQYGHDDYFHHRQNKILDLVGSRRGTSIYIFEIDLETPWIVDFTETVDSKNWRTFIEKHPTFEEAWARVKEWMKDDS